MIIGGALLAAALSLVLWNQREEKEAAEASQIIVEQVKDKIVEETEEEVLPNPYNTEMAVVEMDGYGYIGYLSIPVLGLELPVMGDWSYPQLKIAPCRYYGSVKTDDLVLAAHNYKRHFGRIAELQPGDEILFTDMDGMIICYETEAVEVLSPYAVGEMTAGEYDLTFFTCTYGGQSRVTVRCMRAEKE